MLECAHAGAGSFITLTYSEDKVPTSLSGLPSLEAYHLRDWIKRIRKASEPAKLRYFGVGEYGDRTQRPHYHVALFGRGGCQGEFRLEGKSVVCHCGLCSDVRRTWGFGHVSVGQVTPRSANYIAGYVVKKMMHNRDPRLLGRSPEFARMSLNPGIGAGAALSVALACLDDQRTSCPQALRHGVRLLPLGRYLRRRIAAEMTDGTKEAIRAALGSQEVVERSQKAMQAVRNLAWLSSSKVSDILEEIKVIPTIPTIHRVTVDRREV